MNCHGVLHFQLAWVPGLEVGALIGWDWMNGFGCRWLLHEGILWQLIILGQ